MIVASAFVGTVASRTVPLPPRTWSSGWMVTSWPSYASTANGSAMIGTWPGARTVTASRPVPSARPSESTSATSLRSPPSPWSENATWPCGVKVTVSGAGTVAPAR